MGVKKRDFTYGSSSRWFKLSAVVSRLQETLLARARCHDSLGTQYATTTAGCFGCYSRALALRYDLGGRPVVSIACCGSSSSRLFTVLCDHVCSCDDCTCQKTCSPGVPKEVSAHNEPPPLSYQIRGGSCPVQHIVMVNQTCSSSVEGAVCDRSADNDTEAYCSRKLPLVHPFQPGNVSMCAFCNVSTASCYQMPHHCQSESEAACSSFVISG